jgi:cold shock CspA family protein
MKLINYIINNNLGNEEFTGEVCWFDEKRGQGILYVGEENHEVYFDSSVTKEKNFNRGDLVSFNFNTKITDCSCAKNVIKL